jgi:hypothetical protein
MTRKTLLLALLAFAAATPVHAAEIWRWTDRFGYTHYTQAVDIPERYRASAVPADAPLPAGTPACLVAWHRYAASQACFDAYRVVGGGLKAEAFERCRELPEPEPCR